MLLVLIFRRIVALLFYSSSSSSSSSTTTAATTKRRRRRRRGYCYVWKFTACPSAAATAVAAVAIVRTNTEAIFATPSGEVGTDVQVPFG